MITIESAAGAAQKALSELAFKTAFMNRQSDQHFNAVVIGDTVPALEQQRDVIHEAHRNCPSPVQVGFTFLSHENFTRWANTVNHPIANAIAEATVIADDGRLLAGPYNGRNEHEYTRHLMQEAEHRLECLRNSMDIMDPEMSRQCAADNARAAVTYMTRAVLSAHYVHYPPKAGLLELGNIMAQHLPEQHPPAEIPEGLDSQATYDRAITEARRLQELASSVTTPGRPR